MKSLINISPNKGLTCGAQKRAAFFYLILTAKPALILKSSVGFAAKIQLNELEIR